MQIPREIDRRMKTYHDHDIITLGNLSSLILYHRGKFGEILNDEKMLIDESIIDGTVRSILGYPGRRDRAGRLAMASYQLVDLWNEKIDRRCNWILLTAHDLFVGMVLQYKGDNHIRYFPYGSKQHIKDFLQTWPSTQYGLAEQEADDPCFRVVVPAWQFSLEELDGLVGPGWKLRDQPEITTRVVNSIKDYEPPSITIPDGFQLVRLNKTQEQQVREMVTINYPHNSLHSLEQHRGLIDLSTKEVVAISGIVGQATPPNLPPITLVGNLVTDRRYRGRNFAKLVRTATLQDIKDDGVYRQGIVVTDVNRASEGINLSLGFTRIHVSLAINQLGFAKHYWCIFRPEPVL